MTNDNIKTNVYYVAKRPNVLGAEPGLSANTLDELHQKIKEKFTYPKDMHHENVIYWEDYRKSLLISKQTITYELI